MIRFTPRLWSSVGTSALLASALAACVPGGTPSSTPASGAASIAGETGGEGGGEAASAVTAASVAAAASGEGGGEAGASTVYTGLTPDAAFALRLEHLRGFILVSRAAYADGKAPEEASVLIGQGFLEVYTPAQSSFVAAGQTAIKTQADALIAALDGGAAKADVNAKYDGLLKTLDNAAPKTAAPKQIGDGMLAISSGLYEGVMSKEGDVDPIEFQHSYGAALAVKDTIVRGKAVLAAKDEARYQRALSEADKYVALWGGTVAPAKPQTLTAVKAQASRVQLALSGL